MSAAAGRVIDVAAAVIERPDGSFLLAQRPEGKVYAGWWEFPGGKLEAGESVERALARELHEELGLELERSWPWITREHVYEHGHVRLHFRRVDRWRGEPHGREGQRFAWQARADRLDVSPVLPANGPVLAALALPVAMGITDAAGRGEAPFLHALDRALARGLKLVQFREKALEPTRAAVLLDAVAARVHAAGARLVVNAGAGLPPGAADGVHLNARMLMGLDSRPGQALAGASCHDAAELARACALGLDYVVLGPVRPTASHPGAPVLGWDGFAALAAGLPMPVFAVGGLGLEDLDAARAAGAHGVAGIRGFWR